MYKDHFNLSQEPFSIAPDPAFLYLSQGHNEALAHLTYGLSHGGFVLITGEVGTGKTTILRNLLKNIPDDMSTAFILNPRLSVIELLETVCDELKISTKEQQSKSIKHYVDCLNAYLLKNYEQDRSAVLIIDEAQNLSTTVLEQIRLLTNIETDHKKLLQIILIGQPELEEILSRDELRQLAQRITARYHLKPLSKKETRTYITHRLRIAGSDSSIFTDGAIGTIFRSTGGIPRLINLVSDRALLGAYALNRETIDSALIRESRKEVFGINSKNKLSLRSLPWFAAAVFVALLAGYTFMIETKEEQPKPVYKFKNDTDLLSSPISYRSSEDKHSLSDRLSWPDLRQAVLMNETNKSREAAYSKLFQIWGVPYEPKINSGPCEEALNNRLMCLQRNGSWSEIDLLDTPVVLELWLDFKEPHYGLVTDKTTTGYQISINDQITNVRAVDLSNAWFGSYQTLWRPPPSYSGTLAYGKRHPSIAWLKRLLINNKNLSFNPDNLGLYDQKLLSFIEEFQRAEGLLIDGVIGPLTWIKITNFFDLPQPKLKK